MRGLLMVLALGACKESEPAWITDLRPKLQATLDAHGKKLAPALALVPKTPTAISCSGAAPGKVPTLSQELATRLAADGVKALSMKPRKEITNVLDGDSYRALMGDRWTWSPTVFEPAMKEIADAKQVGVFITNKLEPGHVNGRTIEKKGHWEGWLVLLDLSAPKVLASVQVSADSLSSFGISNDYSADVQLLENLENRSREEAQKALATGCPGLTL